MVTRLAVLGEVHELGPDADVHLTPNAKIGIELQPQVLVADRRTLRRCRLDGSLTHAVGVAAATPEIGDEIADGGWIADQDSHLPQYEAESPQEPRDSILAPNSEGSIPQSG